MWLLGKSWGPSRGLSEEQGGEEAHLIFVLITHDKWSDFIELTEYLYITATCAVFGFTVSWQLRAYIATQPAQYNYTNSKVTGDNKATVRGAGRSVRSA